MTDEKRLLETSLGRSVTGSICGIGAIVLAALGLFHLLPGPLSAVATIVLGMALIFKGAIIAAEYKKLLTHLTDKTNQIAVSGGCTISILTGVAGVILGALALLGISPVFLVAIAMIAFGAGVLVDSGSVSRLNALGSEIPGVSEAHHKLAEEMVSAAATTQILAGAAAIVLGILSLSGHHPETLNLIAILVLGGTHLLSDSTIIGRMIGLIRNP